MKVFCGIADAHGLESFQEAPEIGMAPTMLGMRASLNRQRHALVYWVRLSAAKQLLVEKAIEVAKQDGDWHQPLLLIKNINDEVAVEETMEASWDMIPNDRLDPYWGEEE